MTIVDVLVGVTDSCLEGFLAWPTTVQVYWLAGLAPLVGTTLDVHNSS